MKFRLIKDLPFMNEGTTFVRTGYLPYSFKLSSTGLVFPKYQSELLEKILYDRDWVENVPEEPKPLTVWELIELLKDMPQQSIIRCCVRGAMISTVHNVSIDERTPGCVLINNEQVMK